MWIAYGEDWDRKTQDIQMVTVLTGSTEHKESHNAIYYAQDTRLQINWMLV